MESHIKTLGVLYVAFNALQLIAGVAVMLIFFMGSAMLGVAGVGADHSAEGLIASSIASFLGIAFGSCLLVLSAPGFIAGVGLLQRRRWARILAIVIGAMSLMNIPFGTALGVYTLWALLSADSESYFT